MVSEKPLPDLFPSTTFDNISIYLTDRRRGMKIPIQLSQTMLVGRYGFGVHEFGKVISKKAAISRAEWRSLRHRPAVFNLPRKAKPPTEKQLQSLMPKLALGTKQAGKIRYPFAAVLRDDWTTQGDWTARYGREYALLCAAHFELSFHCASADYATNVDASCGPHHRWPFESMREWETEADTNNPKSLYIPQLGYRRQTNWDDHGETYPTTFQGPDLWIRVHLKNPGIYRLSLYLFNKDGHALYNRQRDWLVEVYPLSRSYWRAMARPILTAMVFPTNPAALQWANGAMAATPLAEARAVNIWNPVYTRFAIAGPGQYMVRIVRGASLNAEISGIFVDKIAAKPTLFDHQPMPCLWGVNYRAPEAALNFARSSKLTDAVSTWHLANDAYGRLGFTARWPARLFAYRLAAASHAPKPLLARWRWCLDMWNTRDRTEFNAHMNKAFRAMLKRWKGLKEFMAKNHELQPNSGELGNG